MKSNWKQLKSKLASSCTKRDGNEKFKRKELSTAAVAHQQQSSEKNVCEEIPGGHYVASLSEEVKRQYVGLDCEMVGIGIDGKQSALARCCVVDFDGNVLYDKHVRPPGFVTDFRTKWSGVRKQDLRAGFAISLAECQKDVANLLKGKILVGHGLKNDLNVLMLSHPRLMIRDTANYKPLKRPHGSKFRSRALKDLAKQYLGITIQEGEHDPGVDARSAMFVFRCKMQEWEGELRGKRKRAKSTETSIRSEKDEDKPDVKSHSVAGRKRSVSGMFPEGNAVDVRSIGEVDNLKKRKKLS